MTAEELKVAMTDIRQKLCDRMANGMSKCEAINMFLVGFDNLLALAGSEAPCRTPQCDCPGDPEKG